MNFITRLDYYQTVGRGVVRNRENDMEMIIPCFNKESSFTLQFVLAPDAEGKGSRREEILTKLLLHSNLSSRCH